MIVMGGRAKKVVIMQRVVVPGDTVLDLETEPLFTRARDNKSLTRGTMPRQPTYWATINWPLRFVQVERAWRSYLVQRPLHPQLEHFLAVFAM